MGLTECKGGARVWSKDGEDRIPVQFEAVGHLPGRVLVAEKGSPQFRHFLYDTLPDMLVAHRWE